MKSKFRNQKGIAAGQKKLAIKVCNFFAIGSQKIQMTFRNFAPSILKLICFLSNHHVKMGVSVAEHALALLLIHNIRNSEEPRFEPRPVEALKMYVYGQLTF